MFLVYDLKTVNNGDCIKF